MEYFAVFIPSIENAGECLLKFHEITFKFDEFDKIKLKNNKMIKKSTQFNFSTRSRVVCV